MKRVLSGSIVIIIMLCFCIPPCTANASGSAGETEFDGKAELIAALGLISAEQNMDAYDEKVSRADFANIVGHIVLNQSMPKVKEQVFQDVPLENKASGYIYFLYKAGIVRGKTDCLFRPEDIITYKEASVMLLYMLGYNAYSAQADEAFANSAVTMQNAGIRRNIKIKDENALTKKDVVGLLYNCLDVPVLRVISIRYDGQYYKQKIEKNKNKTMLTELLGISKITDVVNANQFTSIYNALLPNLSVNQILIGDTVCNYSGRDLLGEKVTAYLRRNAKTDEYSAVYIAEEKKSKSARVRFDAVVSGGGKTKISVYNENGKKQVYRLNPNAAVLYNGKFMGKINTEDIKDNIFVISSGYLDMIDNDDDDSYDVVKITEYENYFVQYINSRDKVLSDYYTGKMLDLNTEHADIILYKEGEEASFGDIKKNNVLSAAVSLDGKLKTVCISSDKATGKIEKITDDVYTINGKDYQLSKGYQRLVEDKIFNADELKTGLMGNFYLDADGCIAAFLSEERNYYGYLVKIGNAEGNSDSVSVRVFTVNGVMKIFQLAEKVRLKNEDTSVTVKASEAQNMLKPHQAIIIDTNAQDEITGITTAASADRARQGVFTKNVSRSSMIYNQSVFNARYRMGNDTMIMFIPNQDTSVDLDDERYYNISDKLSNGGTYLTEIYDLDEMHNAGLIIVYKDTMADILETKYAATFIVDGFMQTLDKEGCAVDVLKGNSEKQEVNINVDHLSQLPDTGVTNWGNLNVPVGGLRFGDVIQYNMIKNTELGRFRILFRAGEDAAYEETWNNGGIITENSIYADLYTAYGEITAYSSRQVVFLSSSGVEKVVPISEVTNLYIVDNDKKMIRNAESMELKCGDKAFFVVTPDYTKEIIVYRW